MIHSLDARGQRILAEMFPFFTEGEMRIMYQNALVQRYNKGDLIFKQGTKAFGLSCLFAGKVKVYKVGVGVREQIVRMVRPKGLLGYRAIFAENLHTASAAAIEPCEICFIDKDTVLKLIKSNYEFSLVLLKTMSEGMGFSEERTVVLTQKHLRGRLADSLLFLKDTYGLESDGQTLKVRMSRDDLASLSNMSTANAIRTLSTFSEEGVVSLKAKIVRLLDIAAIERISQLG